MIAATNSFQQSSDTDSQPDRISFATRSIHFRSKGANALEGYVSRNIEDAIERTNRELRIAASTEKSPSGKPILYIENEAQLQQLEAFLLEHPDNRAKLQEWIISSRNKTFKQIMYARLAKYGSRTKFTKQQSTQVVRSVREDEDITSWHAGNEQQVSLNEKQIFLSRVIHTLASATSLAESAKSGRKKVLRIKKTRIALACKKELEQLATEYKAIVTIKWKKEDSGSKKTSQPSSWNYENSTVTAGTSTQSPEFIHVSSTVDDEIHQPVISTTTYSTLTSGSESVSVDSTASTMT